MKRTGIAIPDYALDEDGKLKHEREQAYCAEKIETSIRQAAEAPAVICQSSLPESKFQFAQEGPLS